MRLPILSLRRKIALTAGVGAFLVVGAVATFAATDPAATLHAQEISLLQQQAALYTQQAQLSTNLAAVEQQLAALENGGTTTAGTAANALPGVGSTSGTTVTTDPTTQAAMNASVVATTTVTGTSNSSASTTTGLATSDPNNWRTTTLGGIPVFTGPGSSYYGGSDTLLPIDATALPGYDAISKAGKLSGKIGPYTYDPATGLAQFLNCQANPTPCGLNATDIAWGLAVSETRATAAGVTATDLANAQAGIAKYGNIWGLAHPGDTAAAILDLSWLGTTTTAGGPTAGNVVPYTTDEISAMNYLKPIGVTEAEFITKMESLGYTPADLPSLATQSTAPGGDGSKTFFTLTPKDGSSIACVPSVITICPTTSTTTSSATSTASTTPAATAATAPDATTNAATVAALQATIAHDTARLATQTAAGNKITAASLTQTLATEKAALAAAQAN